MFAELTGFTVFGRSPSGERGLKLRADLRGVPGNLSLPIRGAWIEMIALPT